MKFLLSISITLEYFKEINQWHKQTNVSTFYVIYVITCPHSTQSLQYRIFKQQKKVNDFPAFPLEIIIIFILRR